MQRRRVAHLRERLVRAQRDRQLVPHAALGHDLDVIDLPNDQPADDLRDHRRVPVTAGFVANGDGERTRATAIFGSRAVITYVRAAATPSAASDGCGTAFNRRSRVSMN